MTRVAVDGTGVLGVAVVLGGLALVLYVYAKKKAGESMAGAAGRVIVNAAADAAVGGVKAIGAQVGIPDTNADKCSQDLANGDYWAASFSCPASDFVGGVAAGASINAAAIDPPAPQTPATIDATYSSVGAFYGQSMPGLGG